MASGLHHFHKRKGKLVMNPKPVKNEGSVLLQSHLSGTVIEVILLF